MKTKLIIIGLAALLAAGCSKSDPKEQVGRFQLTFKPSQSKAPDLVYVIDTATGRVWSMGVRREVIRPDGTDEIEYSEWQETVIKGLKDSH